MKELEGLRRQGVWDESGVRSWHSVSTEARRTGTKVHIGRIFGIVVEKNTQLPIGDKLRKYKGRIVFQGNEVRDERHDYAFFDDVASAPAALEASKSCDAYGLLFGNHVQQSDALQAYTQTDLGGEFVTWVRLPREFWPAAWEKMNIQDPVVPLVKALYGHPRAGQCWEKHAEKHLFAVGFRNLGGWRSTYFHDRLKLMLTVYVDDFKLAGPAEKLKEGWSLIRSSFAGDGGIETDEPADVSKYLGADHIVNKGKHPVSGKYVKTMEYDMSGFMQQCIDAYLDCVGEVGLSSQFLTRIKSAPTPFLDIDDTADQVDGGALAPIAAKVLMKILYAARVMRYDLLRPVAYLASRVTKWSPRCDRQLHRLVCYIAATKHHRLRGYIGDSADKLELSLYSDADFAGCKITKRSTSGIFLALTGPNTFFPLNAISKKQTCVSHSTPEAELVAAAAALRMEGLPALNLWEGLFQRPVKLTLHEDNQAAITVMVTGKNPNMQHMGRTHCVCHCWLHEVVTKDVGRTSVKYCDTKDMAADLMTKQFVDADKWRSAIKLVGLVEGKPSVPYRAARGGA